MNETLFIEAIETMAQAGMCKKISRDTAKRYAAQLKAGGRLSLMLQAEGILKQGQSLLDLTEKDEEILHTLNLWKSTKNLDPKALKALNLLLQMHHVDPMNKHNANHVDLEATLRGPVTLKQPVMKQPVTDRAAEPPISLYGLLSALFQSMKNRREDPEEAAYTVLMRALMGDESYTWNNDMTETDLRIWGRRYGEHAEIIRQNLRNSEQRKETLIRLEDALADLEDMADVWRLREDTARACAHVERSMEDWYSVNSKQAAGYINSEARWLLRQLASMEKGIGRELYQDVTEAELAEKLAILFELALEAAEGSYPPAADVKETLQNLFDEEKNLLAVACCGMPLKNETVLKFTQKEKLRNLVEKGLLFPMDLQLIPAAGVPAGSLAGLADAEGQLKKDSAAELLWILLSVTEAKDAEPGVRTGMFCRLEELAEQLTDRGRRQKILNFILKYHWSNRNHQMHRQAVYSLEQILSLMAKYPEEMQHLLPEYLTGSAEDAPVLLALRNGVTLLEGQLACQCAERCLELAEEEQGNGSWADAAVSRSKTALKLLESAGAPILELRAWLTLAFAYMLRGRQDVGLPEDKWPYTAETLVLDHVIPAFEALEEAKECLVQLKGQSAEAGSQLFAAMEAACRAQIGNEGSVLYQYLNRNAVDFEADLQNGRWFNPTWIRKEGLQKLHDRDVFQVMHRQDRPAKLGLSWYCNTHDSTLACGPAHSQERTEAPLMQLLLSGQTEVMSANQMVDNPYFWNLAQNPHFLWTLRHGLVRVSMFGNLTSLKDYAVSRMGNPNFHWSSLPEEFSNPELRETAQAYLYGSCSSNQLPLEHRQIMMRMRDAVTLMDENLPACWKEYHHQSNDAWMQKRGIGPMIPLAERVAAYYQADRPVEHYHEMRELNQILIKANPNLDRSVYRKMLWAIEAEDLCRLNEMGIHPDVLDECGLAADYLAAERKGMMEDMIRIIDDCQNRMLGERISTHQYYVYDEASARIVPEWHGGPENDSGRLLYRQVEKEIREDGTLLGWALVPERIMDLEKLAAQNPKVDAERLCSMLANQGLSDYDAFGLEGSLRLKKLAFRATSGVAVGREYAEGEGGLYQVEKDVSVHK